MKDIDIDTAALEEGMNSLLASIATLEDVSQYMKLRLQEAANEFQSINFIRSAEAVSGMLASLEAMGENLRRGNLYLSQAAELIRAYGGLRYS